MIPEIEVQKALEVLKKGGVILYPTDTVWGIGCDASREEAIKKIYGIKQRDDSKSMIVLVYAPEMIVRYVDRVPELAWELIEYSTRPLTIIYDGVRGLPASLLASDGTLGIRVCREEFCAQLIFKLRRPLVSTSANISGQATPRFFDEISAEILNAVDYIVEYRQEERVPAEPSSIIRLRENGEIKIIR